MSDSVMTVLRSPDTHVRQCHDNVTLTWHTCQTVSWQCYAHLTHMSDSVITVLRSPDTHVGQCHDNVTLTWHTCQTVSWQCYAHLTHRSDSVMTMLRSPDTHVRQCHDNVGLDVRPRVGVEQASQRWDDALGLAFVLQTQLAKHHHTHCLQSTDTSKHVYKQYIYIYILYKPDFMINELYLLEKLDVDPQRDDDASPMSSYGCMLRPNWKN